MKNLFLKIRTDNGNLKKIVFFPFLCTQEPNNKIPPGDT